MCPHNYIRSLAWQGNSHLLCPSHGWIRTRTTSKERSNLLSNKIYCLFFIYKEKKRVHLQLSFSAALNFGNGDVEFLFLWQHQLFLIFQDWRRNQIINAFWQYPLPFSKNHCHLESLFLLGERRSTLTIHEKNITFLLLLFNLSCSLNLIITFQTRRLVPIIL